MLFAQFICWKEIERVRKQNWIFPFLLIRYCAERKFVTNHKAPLVSCIITGTFEYQ